MTALLSSLVRASLLAPALVGWAICAAAIARADVPPPSGYVEACAAEIRYRALQLVSNAGAARLRLVLFAPATIRSLLSATCVARPTVMG